MRRVCWTADFAEANIVAGLLHANGTEASVFDAGMAQLNWLETLAIGGYRVMVADADEPAAHDMITAYRRGELALSADEASGPACPKCRSHDNVENPNPRRVVFSLLLPGGGDILLIGLCFVFVGWTPLAFALAPQVFAILCAAMAIGVLALLAHLVKRRHRCASCANTWQAEMSQFEALSRAVDAAEAMKACSK